MFFLKKDIKITLPTDKLAVCLQYSGSDNVILVYYERRIMIMFCRKNQRKKTLFENKNTA